MQKTNKKKRAQRTRATLPKAAHHLAVHTDSNSRLVPTLRLEPSATFSIANGTRGTHFIFGTAASAAAVTALRLAQIATQAQVALQQLATLATITVGNQCHNNGIAVALPPHLALLSLLNRQQVTTVGFNADTNGKTYRNTQPCLSAAMYHHHSQQQGSQSFSNGPRPPHHHPPPNQHQNRPSDMLSQAMGFQFPRPTQLPDELESALAIRGARDMDHRLMDHMSQPNQQQNQSSGSGISQHGSFGSNPMTLNSDNQSAHQQGVDWSSYQPPTKLFSGPAPRGGHQTQRHQGPQMQPQSSHAGSSIQSWKHPSDSQSGQARHPQGGGESQSQGMYTPESAGSILASFGLSNEDLEVLSHYPDDQLTPDTLPFILRDIQINKSGISASTSSLTSGIQEMPLHPSRSASGTRSRTPEVPSLLTVTQTAGKVIDYGHASRAKDETSTRKTFKREQLSSERTVKMYPSSLHPSSAPKPGKAERRQVRLEPTEPSKHGDQDYRRTSSDDHRKKNRSPGREFQPSSKPRTLDRDYRREAPKPRPLSETSSEASSRRSLSSSSSSKPHGSSKKLPTPTMISDFSAVSPKVYPHTCSLCHTQCDQEKDWVDHIKTVEHTAACRDLRNKYPDWKPTLPSRSERHGSRAEHSLSRSVSCSHSPSPPYVKHRAGPPHHRLHGRPFSPHYHPQPRPRQQHYTGDSRSCLKRPYDDASRHPSSSKAGHSYKHGPSQSSTKVFKSGKPGTKMTKTPSGKAADTSAKPPPAKKKKKVVTPASQDSSVANRLVYLTGIPKDASEQEVTDLVGSFGKINNVILMPCSEEESEKGEGQKASVCMVKAEDAQALANSTNLSIREQKITASTAKKPDEVKSPDANNSKSVAGPEKEDAREDAGPESDLKTSEEKGMVLITGLPESGWTESDIIKLVQPYGTPSDLILATQIGKVLVSVPDVDTAQEMAKVHAFMPAKIGDAKLKITHLKQSVTLSTPVALYNLLMGSAAPLESPASVGWSSLLVISNVPNTPSGSSEVQKLVRRFGTVIKTLVLNSMVICEMATAAMALSVYKRFQTFPCIIQNNPLFFSRKPDPRANTQSKVISAYLDPTEETSSNGKGSKTPTDAEEGKPAAKEDSGSSMEVVEKETNGKEEKMKGTEEMVVEDEGLGENGNKDDNKEVKKDELMNAASESLDAPDPDFKQNVTETAVAVTVMETAEEDKGVAKSAAGNEKTAAAGEEAKTSISDGKAASQETPVAELPKVCQEMGKTLQEECKTSTAAKSNNTTAPTNKEEGGAQPEKEQGQKASAAETKEPEAKKKEREGNKERELKERERRALEKEERARKEREERARKERERREEERRERERRERRRMHGEGSRGWRSSSRSDGYKQNSERDEQKNNSEATTKMVEKEEEEDFDEFPFNFSDFVTVDEVGDVADLPASPSSDVPMETKDGEEHAPVSVQKEDSEETPTEVTMGTGTPDAQVTLLKSEAESESTPVNVPADGLVSTDESPETTPTASLDSATKVEPLLAPADSSSNSPETEVGAVKAEKECDNALSDRQIKEEQEEMVVSNKTEGQEKMQEEEDKQTRAPAAETVKQEKSEDQTNTEEESPRKKLKTESSSDSLPHFDPSCPVGMEFLVPKTGFFCKLCNRFFSGTKEAEISHCKTFKHYDNLQNFLQSRKTADDAS
ncbi:zinc finger protein 638-like [Labrus mixtus]|uniref:zinc finger protein 638-like n=1 Tax=Labrus mixtus TaxID=508554 RepID=UPI0029C0E43D|nr:zinc finger protein 638-like [Labrus mixtus]